MINEKISLIFTVYNESENLELLFESITRQSTLPNEIVICDGGSSDNTINLIKKFRENSAIEVILIEEKGRINIARGRNLAIKAASGGIIAVTDAGCILDVDWLSEITKPFSDNNIDVVGGWYEPIIKNSFQKKFAYATLPVLNHIDHDTFLPSSRSIAFKKNCWSKVNGYPEHLTLSAEDTLFDIRLKSFFRFSFSPSAIARWEPRDNIKSAIWIHYSMGRGDAEAKIFFKRYVFYLVSIFFPFLYVFTNKRFNYFFIRYVVMSAGVFGYFANLHKFLRR